ncbi:hypothetical protein [Pseudoruegeria sp. SHC-113]|uniref:hypothetical protein n=1 Tax=Pseudoruegeria sp. SHC-113 TaxID=2855439 RepID=UPI0021BB51DC|nr:hypothetical protein [Pseudoruegeria sp. SHC-113]MCT8161860.1 hypothetical protein [Pseudoruegeria sp. SHC-113]
MGETYMHLFKRSLIVLAFAFMASTGQASGVVDRITSQLQDMGYNRIAVSRTLLGRTRIVATAPGKEREIILNPSTGEILRDHIRNAERSRLIAPDGSSSGSSGSSGGGSGSSGSSGGGASSGSSGGSSGGTSGGSSGGGSGGGGDDRDDDDEDDDDDRGGDRGDD